jgi:hypothetical protein
MRYGRAVPAVLAIPAMLVEKDEVVRYDPLLALFADPE